MNRLAFSNLAAAVLIAGSLSDCGRPQAASSGTSPGREEHTQGGVTSQMPICGTAHGPTYVVKVFIDKDWPNGGKRKVVFKNATAPSADDDGNEAGTKDSDKEINPFHIHLQRMSDLSIAINPKKDFWVKVRLVQRDRGATFGTVPGLNGAKVYAIGNGDQTQVISPSSVYACRETVAPQPSPIPWKRQTAIFFIHVPISPPNLSESYNIILLPNAMPDTPNVVDPKIINNG